DWLEKFDEPKQWYFYTNRTTVWRIDNTSWMNKALLDFTFHGIQQDYGKFANAPYWKERFGDTPKNDIRFKWATFYESFADKLLTYKSNRQALTAFIIELAKEYQLSYIIGKDLDDICPFTVMGIFNRGITEQNRKALASALAQFLSVDEPIPESFEAIPILNNQKSWFFAYEENRGKQDIDNLWSIFESALTYADSQNEDTQSSFSALYNQVSSQLGVGWNLTMGLFWIRPWAYPTLDTQSRDYLTSLGVTLNKTGVKGRCSAKDYLT
ncbi:AAA family ATPase, partial [Vibrio parahaemolyticus]